MDAMKLLEQARAAGLTLTVDGDKLHVRGPKSAEPVVRLLAQYKAEVIAILTRKEATYGRCDVATDVAVPGPGIQPVAEPAPPLDPEVAWRVEAMHARVPRTGRIPFLVARSDVVPQPDCCLSCGDLLPEGRRYRCGPCQRAAEAVLNQVREGVR